MSRSCRTTLAPAHARRRSMKAAEHPPRTAAAQQRQGRAQWSSSAPTPWMRQGTQSPAKPGTAEDRRLPARRSISGGGCGNRIAAVDARWEFGQGRHRGIVAGRKTATEGTCRAECRSLGIVQHAILGRKRRRSTLCARNQRICSAARRYGMSADDVRHGYASEKVPHAEVG